jgi:hypothetical protein
MQGFTRLVQNIQDAKETLSPFFGPFFQKKSDTSAADIQYGLSFYSDFAQKYGDGGKRALILLSSFLNISLELYQKGKKTKELVCQLKELKKNVSSYLKNAVHWDFDPHNIALTASCGQLELSQEVAYAAELGKIFFLSGHAPAQTYYGFFLKPTSISMKFIDSFTQCFDEEEVNLFISSSPLYTMEDAFSFLKSIQEMLCPALIIAPKITGDALATLKMNYKQNTAKVAAVECSHMKGLLQALREKLMPARQRKDLFLGFADRVCLHKEEAGLFWTKRAKHLQFTALVSTGQKRALYQQAYHSVVSSKEGAVSGGGAALFHAFCHLTHKKVNPFYKALQGPLIHLLHNAHMDSRIVCDEIAHCPDSVGYDALDQSLEDLIDKGVIDPYLLTKQIVVEAAEKTIDYLQSSFMPLFPS